MKAKVRNAAKVYQALTDEPGKPVIAKKALTIQFPVRFQEIGLAQIGAKTFAFGLVAVILESGEYALLNVNAFLELGPAKIDLVKVDEVEYYSFRYEPGDVVIRTKELVRRTKLIFSAIDEFFFKGKVPYYVGYEDMGRIFDTAKKHAGTRANTSPPVIEFMAAYIARKKNDRIKFIRENANSYGDFAPDKLEWVPFNSVYWSRPGTVNKIAGAYFQEGIVSAIVNPSTRTEKVESILRA